MVETRRVQEIGKSLYISLPRDWTKHMQLKRGDRVTLIPQQDGSISVYPEVKEEGPRQIILDTNEESGQSLRRRITGAYVDGFDIIQLRAEHRFTDKQHDIIRKITEDLFGLEVVDAASNVVTIECLLKPTLPIEKTIHRINNIVKSMFDETVSALKEQDISLAIGVPRRIRDINRLSFVIYRALRSLILSPRPAGRGEMSLIDSVDYLRVLHRITSTAYSIKNTSESIVEMGKRALPTSISEPLSETCALTQKLYDWAVQALVSKDIPLANRVLDIKPDFEKLWNLCLKANKNSQISSLTFSYAHRIIDNLKQTYTYAVEIAEIAIDRAEATSMETQNIRT
ncbi:MAG: phosphate uptake regulator PhoU [Candidatus Bathyarchaeia archaeon]|nr:phosphate uptake regulator PhoU [Candidatus Bathyarchaeia archaeon]